MTGCDLIVPVTLGVEGSGIITATGPSLRTRFFGSLFLYPVCTVLGLSIVGFPFFSNICFTFLSLSDVCLTSNYFAFTA